MAKEPSLAFEHHFDRWRQRVGLIVGLFIFFLLLALPTSTLSVQAHRLSAILGLVIVYWVSEAIPLPVTALLGVILCVILGVAGAAEALSSFADPIISLFIGSFILAEAMAIHGLDRRFALRILSLRWVGESPTRLLFTFGGIAILLSMWVSNTATTAMMPRRIWSSLS